MDQLCAALLHQLHMPVHRFSPVLATHRYEIINNGSNSGQCVVISSLRALGFGENTGARNWTEEDGAFVYLAVQLCAASLHQLHMQVDRFSPVLATHRYEIVSKGSNSGHVGVIMRLKSLRV